MCLTKEQNIEMGKELSQLMEKYPEMKIFTCLNMALKYLNEGKPATYNIRNDWDKYGRGCSFSNELKELCIKYGILHSNGYSWVR